MTVGHFCSSAMPGQGAGEFIVGTAQRLWPVGRRQLTGAQAHFQIPCLFGERHRTDRCTR